MKIKENIILLIFLIIQANSIRMNMIKGRVTFDSLQSFLLDLSSNLHINTAKLKTNEKNIENKKDKLTEARATINTMLNQPKKDAKELLKDVSKTIDKTFKKMKNDLDEKVKEILNGTYKDNKEEKENKETNIELNIETPEINVENPEVNVEETNNEINLNFTTPDFNITIPKIEFDKNDDAVTFSAELENKIPEIKEGIKEIKNNVIDAINNLNSLFDSDGNIKKDLQLPEVNVDLGINSKSDYEEEENDKEYVSYDLSDDYIEKDLDDIEDNGKDDNRNPFFGFKGPEFYLPKGNKSILIFQVLLLNYLHLILQ